MCFLAVVHCYRIIVLYLQRDIVKINRYRGASDNMVGTYSLRISNNVFEPYCFGAFVRPKTTIILHLVAQYQPAISCFPRTIFLCIAIKHYRHGESNIDGNKKQSWLILVMTCSNRELCKSF